MAKQYKNKGIITSAWEVQAQKPLDDRQVVNTANDLTNLDTWLGKDGNYYHYKGMIVACADTGSIYVYIGTTGNTEEVTVASNWIKSSTGNSTGSNVDVVVLDIEPTNYIGIEDAYRKKKGVNAVVGSMVVFYDNSTFLSKLYIKVTLSVWTTFTGQIFSQEAAPVATIAAVNVLSYK